MIERLQPAGAPAPRGPYSPAVRAGDFIYVSGQGPIDTETNQLSLGDIRHETRLVLSNIRRILESCGATLADVAQCTVYLLDGAEFPAMNEVYMEFFGAAKPARTTVVTQFVSAGSGMRIEIDCVAYKPKNSA